MSRYYGGWAPYVSVAERRRRAEREMAKLRKTGYSVAPVTITGRLIAATFWGRAWCDNMESYHDYENRLSRGRTYVRNGSVVDLQVAPGKITANVSGTELYTVTITIKEAAETHWRAICTDCAGSIASLVELLQGRLSKAVMERLCRQEGGLFPRPSDIRFSCSCPDHASMCKHVAAVLYGVGARLDHKPDLLFRLRAVNETDLIAGIDAALPLSKTGPAAGRVLESEDMAALFGLDMAAADAPAAGKAPNKQEATPSRRAPSRSKAAASAADAVVSRVVAATRASTGRLPAKPAGTQQATIAKERPVSATTPAGPKTTRTTLPPRKQPVSGKALTRATAAEMRAGIVPIVDTRQKCTPARRRTHASSGTKVVSVAKTETSQITAQGGQTRAAKAKEKLAGQPKQKPVKWW